MSAVIAPDGGMSTEQESGVARAALNIIQPNLDRRGLRKGGEAILWREKERERAVERGRREREVEGKEGGV